MGQEEIKKGKIEKVDIDVDPAVYERLAAASYREGYTRDRTMGDCLTDEVGLIIGQYNLRFSDYKDRHENTDLASMNSRWAMRIRGREAYDNPQFRKDVSIRLIAAHGAPSEYSKIKAGYSYYMFYGFMDLDRTEYDAWASGASDRAPHLIDWVILDLAALRKYVLAMSPNEENAWLKKYAKKHGWPDCVTCIYIPRETIPGFVLQKAEDWEKREVVTWIRPYGLGALCNDPAIARIEGYKKV